MQTKLSSIIGWTTAALVLMAAMVWLGGTTTRAVEGAITGVVDGPNGAEAGVWVIAETDDLETGLIKIVVTDDDGRFLLPELPHRTLSCLGAWLRAQGLDPGRGGTWR